MDEMPQLLLGWVGSLLVALLLVLGAAMALQSWHQASHQRRPAATLEAATPAPLPAGSTFWSGRK
jgi:hypothetical protein